MKKLIILILAISISGFYSCNNNSGTQNNEVKTEKECKYIYNASKINVHFTTFKHSKRVEVGGKFDSLIVKGKNSAKSIEKLLKGTKFEIFVDGINTNDPGRDKKIKQFFFAAMKNTNKLTGEILSSQGNDEKGKGQISLKMNDIENKIAFDYEFNNNELKLQGIINLISFDGEKAIKSLNDACKQLHTGEDGITKLWPDVKFLITINVDKECE